MANFFDAATGDGITRIQVRKGNKFRIGVYGGGPPPKYERLVVTTEPGAGEVAKQPDPAVTFLKEDGSWNLIYEIDSSKMRSGRVRACFNGHDYSSPVEVQFVSAGEVRTSIVELARTFVARSHYLWGTAGNEPGIPNGNQGGGKSSAASMRAASLDAKETAREKVLAVCTAVQPIVSGYNTCAGRCSRYDQNLDLTEYLKARKEDVKNGNAEQTAWEGAGPQKNLFPRKYYFRSNIQNGGAAVWGESCQGVRHFDCVGLVNYCYARHWYKRGFGLDIVAFRDPVQGTVELGEKDEYMDGDILIKPGNGHIAMLYSKGDKWYVVQAASTESGLSDTEAFSAKAWDRYRVQDAYLRGMDTVT